VRTPCELHIEPLQPFVELPNGLVLGHAAVALQPLDMSPGSFRDRHGQLGLARPRRPFKQQRLLHPGRQVHDFDHHRINEVAGRCQYSCKIEEEKLLEIKQLHPGDRNGIEGELSYSTASSYLGVIKQLREKWGSTLITRIKLLQIQEWLKKMDAAPKSKGHLKAIMHRLYEKARLWEMVDIQGMFRRVGKRYATPCPHCSI
jgi:hypothetical protein